MYLLYYISNPYFRAYSSHLKNKKFTVKQYATLQWQQAPTSQIHCISWVHQEATLSEWPTPARSVREHSMMFTRGGNHVRTHFSEWISVVKCHTTILILARLPYLKINFLLGCWDKNFKLTCFLTSPEISHVIVSMVLFSNWGLRSSEWWGEKVVPSLTVNGKHHKEAPLLDYSISWFLKKRNESMRERKHSSPRPSADTSSCCNQFFRPNKK